MSYLWSHAFSERKGAGPGVSVSDRLVHVIPSVSGDILGRKNVSRRPVISEITSPSKAVTGNSFLIVLYNSSVLAAGGGKAAVKLKLPLIKSPKICTVPELYHNGKDLSLSQRFVRNSLAFGNLGWVPGRCQWVWGGRQRFKVGSVVLIGLSPLALYGDRWTHFDIQRVHRNMCTNRSVACPGW